jgi:hypothetical protein
VTYVTTLAFSFGAPTSSLEVELGEVAVAHDIGAGARGTRLARCSATCSPDDPGKRAVTRDGRRPGLSGNGFGECDGYHEMGDLRLAL